MAKEKLNIVNDDDKVIGIEDRNIIHQKGLLHREVHVHFITPDNTIIFQHRAKDKDTYPDLLDATVGGHVEIGDDYLSSAIKETFEETGIKVSSLDLIPVDKIHKTSTDSVTGKINHAFQQEYIYKFEGNVEDLKIEKGKGLGFELWSFEDILNISDNEKIKFIPYIYKLTSTTLISFVNNNLKKI